MLNCVNNIKHFYTYTRLDILFMIYTQIYYIYILYRYYIMYLNVFNIILNINIFFRPNTTALTIFHSRISKREMYPKNDTYVPLILKNMSALRILSVGEFFGLTCLLLI